MLIMIRMTQVFLFVFSWQEGYHGTEFELTYQLFAVETCCQSDKKTTIRFLCCLLSPSQLHGLGAFLAMDKVVSCMLWL